MPWQAVQRVHCIDITKRLKLRTQLVSYQRLIKNFRPMPESAKDTATDRVASLIDGTGVQGAAGAKFCHFSDRLKPQMQRMQPFIITKIVRKKLKNTVWLFLL